MKNSGLVKYEGYNGRKGKGLKNKRTRKREIIRREEANIRRQAERDKKVKEYSKKNKHYDFRDEDEDGDED